MTARAPIVALAAVLATGAGCSDNDLPDYVRLGGLRVLALKAEPPEVDPATNPTVIVTPLVSDLGNARNLAYVAQGCIDPGVGYGAEPSCEGRPDTVTLGSGSIASLDTPQKTFTGAATAISVPLTAAIFSGRSSVDRHNGIAYLVTYLLTATDPASGAQSSVKAFKRIIATTRSPRNSNPVLSEIYVGAQTLSSYVAGLSFPGGTGTQSGAELKPSLDAGASETYSVVNTQGTASARTEEATTTWFLSSGDIQRFRTTSTSANLWYPPKSRPTSHAMIFVVVTRDGRGGEDFRKIEF
jgi:hypothetical protein